jgi:small subunit ribosomal protein S1
MDEKEDQLNQECNVPELDEGWWNSVLADEDVSSEEPRPINCKPCPTSESAGINWKCMKDLFEKDEIILLTVQGYNKGGLLVQGDGAQGFVPISHLIEAPTHCVNDEERNKFLEKYVGKSMYVKIIECEPSNERIVFSERAAQAGQGKRNELFDTLKPGVTACGVITNVTEFGAFVDLGGVEGLIHVSEISWGRVDKPADILQVGSKVKVMILQVNPETSRIALSIKRLTENPWDELESKYKEGDIVSAEITSIMKFGIFARLNEGVEGLIHISCIPDEARGRDLREEFTTGQPIQVRILHIDSKRRRLGLGLALEV